MYPEVVPSSPDHFPIPRYHVNEKDGGLDRPLLVIIGQIFRQLGSREPILQRKRHKRARKLGHFEVADGNRLACTRLEICLLEDGEACMPRTSMAAWSSVRGQDTIPNNKFPKVPLSLGRDRNWEWE